MQELCVSHSEVYQLRQFIDLYPMHYKLLYHWINRSELMRILWNGVPVMHISIELHKLFLNVLQEQLIDVRAM